MRHGGSPKEAANGTAVLGFTLYPLQSNGSLCRKMGALLCELGATAPGSSNMVGRHACALRRRVARIAVRSRCGPLELQSVADSFHSVPYLTPSRIGQWT